MPRGGMKFHPAVIAWVVSLGFAINAAYALKQERTTGSLEPGKLGDLIVLDRDIFAIDPFDLHNTRVLATYLDGREVYADKAK
jgi:predicted amidohydrolase YtcJ